MSFLFKFFKFLLSYLFKIYLKITILFPFFNEESFFKRIKIIENIYLKNFFLEIFIKKFPSYPYSYYLKYIIEKKRGKDNLDSFLDKYSILRNEYIKEKLNKYKNREYADVSTFSGALGNTAWFKTLLLANKLKLRKKKKIFFIKRMKITNPVLFSYFKKYIHIISDKKQFDKHIKLESKLLSHNGSLLELKDKFIEAHVAQNIILRKNSYKRIQLLKLNKSHKSLGKKFFDSLGIDSNNDWIVTLHIREGNYRRNEKDNNYRNNNPADYIETIKLIIDNGGYVFRMGHTGSTKFFKHERFFDYANYDKKKPELEIFLAASSKFSICTSSGFYTIPAVFDVPVLLTNCPNHSAYFELSKHDVYLPKLFIDTKNNKFIKIRNLFKYPYCNLNWDFMYKKFSIKVVDNTPLELKLATLEMINKLIFKKKTKNHHQSEINKKIIKIKKFENKDIIPLANISSSFLINHRNLL